MSKTIEDPPSVLLPRLLKTQNEIKRLTLQHEDQTSDAVWLRHMAALRRELAAVYLMASNNYAPNSIEWHGLREASLMHDFQASANVAVADGHDKTTKDDAP
jgi:hypothetical protein